MENILYPSFQETDFCQELSQSLRIALEKLPIVDAGITYQQLEDSFKCIHLNKQNN